MSRAINPKGQGQIIWFLINASSPKLLYVATSNFAGDRSYDVESTGKHFL